MNEVVGVIMCCCLPNSLSTSGLLYMCEAVHEPDTVAVVDVSTSVAVAGALA